MENKQMTGRQESAKRQRWNVDLWINNDQRLYRMAFECLRHAGGNRRKGARNMFLDLNAIGTTKTPDGYRYTISAIYDAMEGMVVE